MVKKVWNLLNLKRILQDVHQETTIKTKISVKIIKGGVEDGPDFVITQVDLHNKDAGLADTANKLAAKRGSSERFHRITFYLNFVYPQPSALLRHDRRSKTGAEPHLNIRILDTDYNVLADGLTRSNQLSLSFYTEKSLVRVEVLSINMIVGDFYHITKIQQESYTQDEVFDNESVNRSASGLIESVLEDEEGLRSLKGLGRHGLWSYLRRWDFILDEFRERAGSVPPAGCRDHEGEGRGEGQEDHILVEIQDESRDRARDRDRDDNRRSPNYRRAIGFHKERLLLNRGNLLCDVLRRMEGRELAAVLLWCLRVDDHYKDSLLTSYIYDKRAGDTSQNVINMASLESRSETLVGEIEYIEEDIERSKKERVDYEQKVDGFYRERTAKISELERVLNSGSNPNSNDKTNETEYVSQISEKKRVLEELKAHLMKELVRQNNCKRVSEILQRVISSEFEKDNLFVETIDNYGRQIISIYNMIGKDLLRIEEEIERISNLRNRLEKEKGTQEIVKDNEKRIMTLKNQVKTLTEKINDLNKKITEEGAKIAILEVQKSSVFYSFLENLLETKLRELYAI